MDPMKSTRDRLDRVREAAKEAGKAVAILVDLQGPKIRLARFENGPHESSSWRYLHNHNR